jgi:hypothetical protein
MSSEQPSGIKKLCVNGLQHFGLPYLLLGSLPVLLLLLGYDPPGSSFLRFRRLSLRRHFLLAPRKDHGSGGGGLGGGLGDLICDRALNGGGRGSGGGVHLHGLCFGREWRACRAGGGKWGDLPLSAGPEADKRDAGGGRARGLGRRISGPNLRPKWVRADKIGLRCLFGPDRWVAICPF